MQNYANDTCKFWITLKTSLMDHQEFPKCSYWGPVRAGRAGEGILQPVESCRDLVLFMFSQLLFRKLACQSIHTSILIIFLGIFMASRKWSPCNEVRWNYFSGELVHCAWIFNSFPFRIIRGCGGSRLWHMGRVHFLILFYLIKEELRAHSSWQPAVFLRYI